MLDSSDFLFVNHHGSIAEALLHRSLIALREEIHEPSSDILGGRIEIKHLVEIGVIHLAMHRFLDMGEIYHHAILVQLSAHEKKFNLPVVTMQTAALTLVTEGKRMGS